MSKQNTGAETLKCSNSKDIKRRIKIRFSAFYLLFSSVSISKASALPRFFILSIIFSTFAAAQKIAVVAPETNAHSARFAEKLSESLKTKFSVLDNSLSETAFRSATVENPFNLSTSQAKSIGSAIGGDFYALIKSGNQRRSTFEKKDFYESYAVVFVVSTRTGRLVFWKLQSYEAENEAESEKLLLTSIGNLAAEISEKLKVVSAAEISEKPFGKIEEIPPPNSPEAKNFRPPLPFKRIKPEYIRLAYVYDVTATIDVSVDIGADGEILRAEIERWAGYGLDESVTETVRQMNWRPAERDGKALPARILLRYNFKRIEK